MVLIPQAGGGEHSSFISSMDLGKLIAAGVLTPVLGLIGTKVKEMLEARDVRQQSKRLMEEVTSLLAFAETLQKASDSGSALAAVPPESLAELQSAIAARIKAAVTHISPGSAAKIEERHLARDIFDRLFLLHRPLVWWGWALHAVYYGILGVLGAVVPLVIGDFQSKDTDNTRWAGVAVLILIAVPGMLMNVLANAVDRRKSREMALTERTENALGANA